MNLYDGVPGMAVLFASVLAYARKHAGIVQKICRQDSRYDLISGNSGWIIVLLQLFRLTGEEQYLSFAVEAGKMKMSAEI